MDLKERRALVEGRYAKAGHMDEGDEEILLAQAKFGLRQARHGYRSRGHNAPDLGRDPHNDPYSHPLFMSKAKLRRKVFVGCVARAAAKHPKVVAFREGVLGGSFPLTYKQAL